MQRARHPYFQALRILKLMMYNSGHTITDKKEQFMALRFINMKEWK